MAMVITFIDMLNNYLVITEGWRDGLLEKVWKGLLHSKSWVCTSSLHSTSFNLILFPTSTSITITFNPFSVSHLRISGKKMSHRYNDSLFPGNDYLWLQIWLVFWHSWMENLGRQSSRLASRLFQNNWWIF